MTLSGGALDAPILADVFHSVLLQMGLNGEATDRLVDQMMAARRAAPAGGCTLQLDAHAGELTITLSQAGRDWRASCPVPVK
jgi:hypothetical protein